MSKRRVQGISVLLLAGVPPFCVGGVLHRSQLFWLGVGMPTRKPNTIP
jgi:hypothetical protein